MGTPPLLADFIYNRVCKLKCKILDTTLSHVGIVERVEKGRVYTIEGNSHDIVQEK